MIVRELARALPNAGSNIDINSDMIEITTSNSMSVKPVHLA
tara:strand:+ start:1928 stop:2050 length:123 start_codon:yes stop_codon:yes gene_type:complete